MRGANTQQCACLDETDLSNLNDVIDARVRLRFDAPFFGDSIVFGGCRRKQRQAFLVKQLIRSTMLIYVTHVNVVCACKIIDLVQNMYFKLIKRHTPNCTCLLQDIKSEVL